MEVLMRLAETEARSAAVDELARTIESSQRVQRLLGERNTNGDIPFHPYAKWYGAHWVLACLAELGYPPGDRSLIPLREQVLKAASHTIRCIAGRVRQHASQEGNALFYLLTLGLADERTELLADRLRQWQWPDGGWNCDSSPNAVTSSFTETLIPLRGLALHARLTGNKQSAIAAQRAAEVFLKRRLFRRAKDGRIISEDFLKLRYPRYWHYDVLFALTVVGEAGFLSDPRCGDALDVLEQKRLPNGGWPAEGKHYRVTDELVSGRSLVAWGEVSKSRMDEFITVEALSVVKQARRFGIDRDEGIIQFRGRITMTNTATDKAMM